MKAISLLVLFTAAACASEPPIGPRPSGGPSRVDATGADMIVSVNNDPVAAPQTLAGAPDRVWPALQAAYGELGLPVGAADGAAHALASGRVAVNRRFNGEPASAFLDCGRTMSGEPAADAYRVVLTVRSVLAPARGGGATELRTSVDASARNPEGTSASPVRCASTGRLEGRIADRVRLRLAGG
jgi:hypothetical protein